MGTWTDNLNGDPLPWLLDESAPAVRPALPATTAGPRDRLVAHTAGRRGALANNYPYNGKMVASIDSPGAPSR